MATGNIYSLFVDFNQKTGGKERFTVEISQIGLGIVVLDDITSKYEKKSDFIKLQYYPIKDWREAGLKQPSYVDIGSRHTLSLQEMVELSRYMGKLSLRDVEDLAAFIHNCKDRLLELKTLYID